jgi:hypothetical protein
VLKCTSSSVATASRRLQSVPTTSLCRTTVERANAEAMAGQSLSGYALSAMTRETKAVPRHYVLHCEPASLTLTAGEATLRHGRPGALGAHGSIDDKGKVGIEVNGVPARGREGEREVAERLVRQLNDGGGSWRIDEEERQVDDDVDVAAIDATGAELKIQVTRVATEARWAMLGRTGRVGEQLDHACVADELFETICKKADAYGPQELRALELVVDVRQLPSHTFNAVIENLKGRHGEAIATFGFRATWVVGSRDDLVFRVDD